MSLIELLSPAGNMDCLKAAINSGANAVYIGLQNYSARSFANNFTEDEIAKAVSYAHLRGVKIYVAINTLLDNRELIKLEKDLCYLNDIGVDAIIVQDLGVFYIASVIAPDLPIHASTQMTVHNLEGSLALQNLGFKRIVLARELSFDEIKYISNNLEIETEVFIHGAHCVSYSGQCLMSSFLGGRSGNRGKCAQPCRLQYSCGEAINKTLLSMKDMSLIENIDMIKNCGAASLKIEGRMKGVNYVEAVTSAYSKYLRSGAYPPQGEIADLHSVFDRGGYTGGYFKNKIGKDMFCFDKPDNPYKNNVKSTKSVLNEKIPVDFYYEIKENNKASLKLTAKGKTIKAFSEYIAERAQKSALTEEKVINQILKIKDTPFAPNSVSGLLEENLFMPASALNDLRRTAILMLSQELIKNPKRESYPMPKAPKENIKQKFLGFTVQVSTKNQLKIANSLNYERILVPVNLLSYVEDFSNLYAVLPRIIKDSEKSRYQEEISKYKNHLKGIYIGNMGHLSFANENNLKACFDFGFNIFNSYSTYLLNNFGSETITLSTELSLPKISDISSSAKKELIAYGKIPLMITENCIVKNGGSRCCSFGNKDVNYIEDRKNAKLPVMKSGYSCRSEIYNSVPIYMADKVKELKESGVSYLRLFFTDEDSNTMLQITSAYLKEEDYTPNKYTRGYFYKNIE